MLNIGNCYFCEKDYDKAIKYYKMEGDIEFLGEKLIGQRYNNLGSCYAQKKQNQQSLKCFN
jgi:tetratricopeptide (TPR) repeat protein